MDPQIRCFLEFRLSSMLYFFDPTEVPPHKNGWTCSQVGHKKYLQRGISTSRDGVTEQRLEASHNVQERKFVVLDNF
jgi:hypothetical protein